MLDRCLRTLLASAAVDLHVIVVANHCEEPLPALVEESPRVHAVVSEVSLGFSNANNLGVHWSRQHLGAFDYFYFINNDTASAPEALGRQIAALRRRPSAALAGPTLRILGAPDHYNSMGLNVTEDGWGWDEGIGLHVNAYGPQLPTRPVLAVTGAALLIEAGMFDRVGGWTEAYEYYMEDIDLAVKVWKQGGQVIQVADAMVYHQISATMTEGSDRKLFFFYRNRILLALIHWPLGLAWKTLRIARQQAYDERRDDQPIPKNAYDDLMGRIPKLIRWRWRFRGRMGWARLLRPSGSVPVIQLPETSSVLENPETWTLPRLPAPGGEPEDRLRHAQDRIDDLEARLDETQHMLNQIHESKFWGLWMFTIRLRQWVLRPLRRG